GTDCTLSKQGPAAGASFFFPHTFLGAGTYDSINDKIVVFGGISAFGADTSVNVAITDNAKVIGTNLVYEYTPASQSTNPSAAVVMPSDTTQGRWDFVPACTSTAPVARYGHSMSFDPLNQQLIVVGGYGVDGNPLSQNVTFADTTMTQPEVWVGKRISSTITASTTNPVSVGAMYPLLTASIVASSASPCYLWAQVTTFGNEAQTPSQRGPEAGLAHAAAVFIPSTGYNTGYYSFFDNQCAKAGPIASPDPEINKLLAGGAYFDIDRTQLGPNENLLLNITYIPLGTNNQDPNSQQIPSDQTAFFKVHLVRTGQSGDQLRGITQPRYFSYNDQTAFPEIAQEIAILAPPTGQIRQDQVLLPISIDPTIDRIRIERYAGSGILIDASLYRMGYR
ncbi:MAG: hypothetical protein ACXVBW_08605, partial [Bdellovibrionota bacterium]